MLYRVYFWCDTCRANGLEGVRLGFGDGGVGGGVGGGVLYLCGVLGGGLERWGV